MAEPIAEFESEYRKKEPDESIIDYYCDLRKNEQKDRTLANTRTAWNHLKKFQKEREIEHISSINSEIAGEFIEYLRSREGIGEDSTVKGNVQKLSQMIDWFNDKSIMSGNPFKIALRQEEFADEPGSKLEVPITDLRNGIIEIENPALLAFITLCLKTGLRIAEAINLDERDINIDHPISKILDDPRPQLKGKTDTIWIESTINKGDSVNGEVREHSNKNSSTRAIPLTDETKQALVWYLAMRPVPNSDANPIFVCAATSGKWKSIGDRHSPDSIRNQFNQWSDEQGWYDPDDPQTVKPHWCRHWFTTTIRSNVDPDLIEVGTKDDFEDFLRGDTSSESKGDYLHMSWGSSHWMREALEDSLPSLFSEQKFD